MKKIFFQLLFIITITAYSQNNIEVIQDLIEKGDFNGASLLIDNGLNDKTLSPSDKLNLQFQRDVMDRIRIDFRKTEENILKYLSAYYPDIKPEDLKKWEDDKTLEYKIIDGKKLYFNQAGPNLFRNNSEARKVKKAKDGDTQDKLDEFLIERVPKVLDELKQSGKNLADPVILTLDYTLTVDANAVPPGEIVRCWLPFPRIGHQRQERIVLESVNVNDYIIAGFKVPQRTIYLEKMAEKDSATVFKMKLNYTAYWEWTKIIADNVKKYNKENEDYKLHTAERPPHIQFTDELKQLSKKIIGDESNPYLIAKKIFTWIDENIPWASAREYSTIPNISLYCYKNMHGDCGIKSLLFMTLCRMNGIPAKWQSGWMLHPPEVNLHDWCEIYFEGYGWVPVDMSFGIQKSNDEDVKYFYLGGIDAYRLIANDDYSQPLYPAKIYPRSETVDFQRGEVEWRGGNLYFDKWDYHMSVGYSK